MMLSSNFKKRVAGGGNNGSTETAAGRKQPDNSLNNMSNIKHALNDDAYVKDSLLLAPSLLSMTNDEDRTMYIDLEDVLGDTLMRATGYRTELEDILRSNDLVALFFCGDDDSKDHERLESLMQFERDLKSSSSSIKDDRPRRFQVVLCPSAKVLADTTSRTEFYRQTCRKYRIPSNWLLAIRCRHHITKYMVGTKTTTSTAAATARSLTASPRHQKLGFLQQQQQQDNGVAKSPMASPRRIKLGLRQLLQQQQQQQQQQDYGTAVTAEMVKSPIASPRHKKMGLRQQLQQQQQQQQQSPRQQDHGHLVVVKAMTGHVVSMGAMHLISEQFRARKNEKDNKHFDDDNCTDDEDDDNDANNDDNHIIFVQAKAARDLFDSWYKK